MIDFSKYHDALANADLVRVVGKVVQVVGLVIEAQVQGVSIGELCQIEVDDERTIEGEVVGFQKDKVLLMPLGQISGIRPGSRVYPTGNPYK